MNAEVSGSSTGEARADQDDADQAAITAWWELPEMDRAEVLELAKSGERHPDAEVRAAAERWARAVLRRRPWGLIGTAAGLVVALASTSVGMATNDPEPALDRNNVYRRRQARQILRAGDQGSQDSPDD